MRPAESVLILKGLLATLLSTLFSLLLLSLAPLSQYHLRLYPEVDVFTLVIAPLAVLYVLSLYLTFRGVHPHPIVLTFAVVHSFTWLTGIIPGSIEVWAGVLVLTLLSLDTGSRLALMTALSPRARPLPKGEHAPSGREAYIRGGLLRRPDPFTVRYHALILLVLAGLLITGPYIMSGMLVAVLALFVYPAVVVVLLMERGRRHVPGPAPEMKSAPGVPGLRRGAGGVRP